MCSIEIRNALCPHCTLFMLQTLCHGDCCASLTDSTCEATSLCVDCAVNMWAMWALCVDCGEHVNHANSLCLCGEHVNQVNSLCGLCNKHVNQLNSMWTMWWACEPVELFVCTMWRTCELSELFVWTVWWTCQPVGESQREEDYYCVLNLFLRWIQFQGFIAQVLCKILSASQKANMQKQCV